MATVLKEGTFEYLLAKATSYKNKSCFFLVLGIVFLIIIPPLGILLLLVALVFWFKRRPYNQGIEGERKVSQTLNNLGSKYYLLDDIQLYSKAGNVDHFVLGPNGIFAIETKNYTGRISYEEDIWFRSYGSLTVYMILPSFVGLFLSEDLNEGNLLVVILVFFGLLLGVYGLAAPFLSGWALRNYIKNTFLPSNRPKPNPQQVARIQEWIAEQGHDVIVGKLEKEWNLLNTHRTGTSADKSGSDGLHYIGRWCVGIQWVDPAKVVDKKEMIDQFLAAKHDPEVKAYLMYFTAESHMRRYELAHRKMKNEITSGW